MHADGGPYGLGSRELFAIRAAAVAEEDHHRAAAVKGSR